MTGIQQVWSDIGENGVNSFEKWFSLIKPERSKFGSDKTNGFARNGLIIGGGQIDAGNRLVVVASCQIDMDAGVLINQPIVRYPRRAFVNAAEFARDREPPMVVQTYDVVENTAISASGTLVKSLKGWVVGHKVGWGTRWMQRCEIVIGEPAKIVARTKSFSKVESGRHGPATSSQDYVPTTVSTAPCTRQKKNSAQPLVLFPGDRAMVQNPSLPVLKGQAGLRGELDLLGSLRSTSPVHRDADRSTSKTSRSAQQKKELQSKNWQEKVIPNLIEPFMELMCQTDNLR
ncbi:hypothetical protein K435DRAFT_797756 [Dendrothele bispora CBS 962.96]|uniref:Uncharacterized protein n=1 Tax=Dendrothele bispora (strain CBS 962.96) TaxID=1314807 RepID=A0A4S8M1C8_DENBC|nr:hypothetical protein K435DRAFT_797756 [Dendrothele bispora CBS 962.96]